MSIKRIGDVCRDPFPLALPIDLSLDLCKHRKYSPVKQEAQLLPRGRAMLRVVEYFAKSLKVIRNDILSRACVSPY